MKNFKRTSSSKGFMSWSKQHWLILSLFLLATTFISLQFVFSLPVDGGLDGEYGCYHYQSIDSPGTQCTLGNQNCARYLYEASPSPGLYTLVDNDADNDGYYAICGQDCDDGSSGGSVNPGATEVCGNAVDEDCDGIADACPLDVTHFTSHVSGTTVTLTATTNYVASCCFSKGASSDYDTCVGSNNNIDTVTTDSSGVASVSTSQTAGTQETYHVYCRSPP